MDGRNGWKGETVCYSFFGGLLWSWGQDLHNFKPFSDRSAGQIL